MVQVASVCIQPGLVCRGKLDLPAYDKSAHSGAGDRVPKSKWPFAMAPLSVVLFEGWMLGFRPVGEAAARAIHPGLVDVDRYLASYEPAWDCTVHAWVVVEVADPLWVHQWRLQAEHAMRAAGKDGMDDSAVHAFVERYMPAYTAYLPELYRKGPTTAEPGNTLFLQVDQHRCLTGGRLLQA
jgi:D-glycerate 3-kinase